METTLIQNLQVMILQQHYKLVQTYHKQPQEKLVRQNNRKLLTRHPAQLLFLAEMDLDVTALTQTLSHQQQQITTMEIPRRVQLQ